MQALLVRDYVGLVIADMCGTVCSSGKGFLPDLVARRAPSRFAKMTGTRWGSSNRFQGLDGAHAALARTVCLTGRRWLGSFVNWVSCGIQSR